MKKILYMLLAVVMILGLSACGSEKQEAATEEGFSPSLDTSADGQIIVAGGYDNFEALEAEFDKFNEYYPNVELTFTKVDDYNNMIGMVLDGNDAPDIYVNYSWMYGRDQYQSCIDHAEDLADSSLGLDLDCIRSNIIHTGGAPALRPGAIAQSPGQSSLSAGASLPKPCPASSVRAREGAGCGSVGAVSGA